MILGETVRLTSNLHTFAGEEYSNRAILIA
jgi:hypothetical protein